jgi:hypothetical protein
VLDEHAVFEHSDLRAGAGLAYDHHTLNIFATGEELGFGQDWCTATAMVTTFATTLTLGFETCGALKSADRVTRLADLDDGAGRVIGGTLRAFGSPTATTSTATR